MDTKYYVGVHLKCELIKVSLIDNNKNVVKEKTESLIVYNPQDDYFEQSSEIIWKKICFTVKQLVANLKQDDIVGIGFTADEALVVIGENNQLIKLAGIGNVLPWMDMRAKSEAIELSSSNDKKINSQMLIPKILWLNRMKHKWNEISRIFAMCDFLIFKATGIEVISVVPPFLETNNNGLSMINLNSMIPINNEGRLNENRFPLNLLESTALSMGLSKNVQVASTMSEIELFIKMSMISLQSVKVVGSPTENYKLWSGIEKTVTIIDDIGVMDVTEERNEANMGFMVLPQLNEFVGLDNGSLVKHIIKTHPNFPTTFNRELSMIEYFNGLFTTLKHSIGKSKLNDMAKRIYIIPETMQHSDHLGGIFGVKVIPTVENLFCNYMAIIQTLAYVIRESLECNEDKYDYLLLAGTLSMNNVFIECLADICEMPVLIRTSHSNLITLGTSMLAQNLYNLKEKKFATELECSYHQTNPDETFVQYHNKKFATFKRLKAKIQDFKK